MNQDKQMRKLELIVGVIIGLLIVAFVADHIKIFNPFDNRQTLEVRSE